MSILFIIGAFLLLGGSLFVLARPVIFYKSDNCVPPNGQLLGEQLEELDQINSADLIDKKTLPGIKLETQRAALDRQSITDQKNSRTNTIIVTLFLALAPLWVAGVYIYVGSPFPKTDVVDSDEGLAFNPDDLSAPEEQQMIAGMVNRLTERLDQNPDDIDGWRMLGRSKAVLGKYQASIDAYKRVVQLNGEQVSDWKALAQIQLAAEGAEFTTNADFLNTLAEIDKRAPDDVFVLYYRGGAARLTGNLKAALIDWKKMLSRMPDGIPARDVMEKLIAETEAAGNAASNVSD